MKPVGVAALCAVVMTGCSAGGGDPVAALRALPSLEDTARDVGSVVEEIVAAADAAAPGLVWTQTGGSVSVCTEAYAKTDGQRQSLPARVGSGVALGEEQWARVEAAARAAAARVGATEVQVMQDGPGNHDEFLLGPGGMRIQVGYAGDLAISASTGCRLAQKYR
jgi:hypothetical protein